jgi:hypothetical protein
MGAVLALRQTDLKLVLAYSTISALGTLTMSLGLSMPSATIAAMTFLLAHAFYKGALFLTAGAIEHATGTRDATEVGGLGSVLPLTAAGAMLAALSMAGAPFLFGFVGKELLLQSGARRRSRRSLDDRGGTHRNSDRRCGRCRCDQAFLRTRTRETPERRTSHPSRCGWESLLGRHRDTCWVSLPAAAGRADHRTGGGGSARTR